MNFEWWLLMMNMPKKMEDGEVISICFPVSGIRNRCRGLFNFYILDHMELDNVKYFEEEKIIIFIVFS